MYVYVCMYVHLDGSRVQTLIVHYCFVAWLPLNASSDHHATPWR
jgi:hypothetical protein